MPTVMNQHTSRRHHSDVSFRTTPQKVCIGLGIAFIIIGLAGVMMPGFMGMHLSFMHNLIHLGSGAFALWAGYGESNRAYKFCITFGAIYGLLGLAGFLIGQPGYPEVGHLEADQYLFRVIPNVLELGTVDHLVHILLSAVFLGTALVWKKRRNDVTGSNVIRKRGSHTGRDTYRMNDTSLSGINSRTTLGDSDHDSNSRRNL